MSKGKSVTYAQREVLARAIWQAKLIKIADPDPNPPNRIAPELAPAILECREHLDRDNARTKCPLVAFSSGSLRSYPPVLSLAATLMAEMCSDEVDYIADAPTIHQHLHLPAAIALAKGLPHITPWGRKNHGMMIEGLSDEVGVKGKSVVIVQAVLDSGYDIAQARRVLEDEGLEVAGVVILINARPYAHDNVGLFDLPPLVKFGLDQGFIETEENQEQALRYLKSMAPSRPVAVAKS